MTRNLAGVQVAPIATENQRAFSTDALAFYAELHRRFNAERLELLRAREERQKDFDAGALPTLPPETLDIRNKDWKVAPIPVPLQRRIVEITGPVEPKMMVNALNSGADVFMGDFEDSLSPTWANITTGHRAAIEAIEGTLRHEDPGKGKTYELNTKLDQALLILRVRGLHLPESHVTVDGEDASGALFDFAISFYNTAKLRLEQGEGPYYYLPKLEHYLEARWWNRVIVAAQDLLGLPLRSTKCTVLIETFPAVYQMEEILFELADHMAGLNAGRWDYIFSAIKTRRTDPTAILPDRSQVTMTVPFMAAYQERLVAVCHRRGAFAMGGMSAFIPNRKDEAVTNRALAAVQKDKHREAKMGCDGTWVAHPDLIPIAREAFEATLRGAKNQLATQPKIPASTSALADFHVEGGVVTRQGLKANILVAVEYIQHWLAGRGAVALHNLMEDAATAEISRYQVWQWVRHGVALDGAPITRSMVQDILYDIQGKLGPESKRACALFLEVATGADPPTFLTLPAYEDLKSA